MGAWRIHLWLGETEKRWECEGRGGVVGKERWHGWLRSQSVRGQSCTRITRQVQEQCWPNPRDITGVLGV